MNRPYVFCHMMTSLDGKIMGRYMETKEGEKTGNVFYNISFGNNPYYKHQGWLSGRVTTDDNFTFYKKPLIDENADIVAEGNFIADDKKGMYYISIDPYGKLGWESSELTYIDTNAHVIEVLTKKAGNAYKAFLRKKGISYIIAGKERINFSYMLQVLKNDFHMETVMLGGGGVLNWSFIKAGLCDEISVVIAPTADGSTTAPTLFQTKEGLTEDVPVGFKLKEVNSYDDGTIWIRYYVKTV
ncbi:dihydrofolate reductase family protein [Clostridium butyricum]|uniref:dihydrofolate reductase family protein n=1 Tax=Clostridium butyricum TaxID=1492 RepID=UPI0006E6B0BD|nr:RibD family protein [Clostridium butyricum]KQB79562.1 5-amino-6-(5-phosphoribosylamino)uracil reductase [Clostridium butyricum]MDU0325004.1 RibD family protein [Clostridium butyricum]